MEDNLVVRQTYIMLAVKDNIKYIFNRSVRWDSIISCKKIQPLLNLLGEDVIKHFSESLFENNTEKMYKAINSFTRGFLGDYPLGYLKTIGDVDLFVIQILPFENINRSDQQEINKVKNDLCEKFDAKCVKDEFIGDEIIDKLIGKNIKEKFMEYIKQLYTSIGDYLKNRTSDIVQIMENEERKYLKLKNDINNLYAEYVRKKNEYNRLLKESHEKVKYNRDKINRQNYIIKKNDDKINNIQKLIDYEQNNKKENH